MNPDAIRNQRFLLVRRGYDPDAVLAFLDEVADALEAAMAPHDGPDADAGVAALDVVDADRLVDEARTRAATHRLRAQRDIEALQRTARSRRARLVAEIEELAIARDQLSDDLDRAVDVVDRVVQWVRRTDPGAPPTGPGPALADVADDPDSSGPEEAVVVLPDVEPGADDGPADDPAADEGPIDESPEDDEVPDDEIPDDGPDATVEPASGEEDEALGVADVRTALRAVQDDVLANLRDRPGGPVEEWVPSATVLLALDDAATPAAGRAFLAGWGEAAPGADPDAQPDADPDADPDDDRADVAVVGARTGRSSAVARDALEDVRGAGSLPGLGIADDLRIAIRASLQRGVDAGDAGAQLVERVAEVHRDVRQTVVVDALELVVGAAHHHGMVARWRHDDVAAVAWVLGEERRCPGRRCRANAGDGVVAPGEAFAFGELVPPAHVGCTCTLRPAAPDDAVVDG